MTPGVNVECDIEYDDIENERGELQEGVRVTCGRCGSEEESFGTGVNSITRCFALLGVNCPRREKNHYYSDET